MPYSQALLRQVRKYIFTVKHLTNASGDIITAIGGDTLGVTTYA